MWDGQTWTSQIRNGTTYSKDHLPIVPPLLPPPPEQVVTAHKPTAKERAFPAKKGEPPKVVENVPPAATRSMTGKEQQESLQQKWFAAHPPVTDAPNEAKTQASRPRNSDDFRPSKRHPSQARAVVKWHQVKPGDEVVVADRVFRVLGVSDSADGSDNVQVTFVGRLPLDVRRTETTYKVASGVNPR